MPAIVTVTPKGRLRRPHFSAARPSDLPVQQVARLEMALNLKTAKALGFTIPLALLARTHEMIE